MGKKNRAPPPSAQPKKKKWLGSPHLLKLLRQKNGVWSGVPPPVLEFFFWFLWPSSCGGVLTLKKILAKTHQRDLTGEKIEMYN